jgi:DNA-binding transcriptional regulator PaaX
MIARELGLSHRDVQNTLHRMDDDGDVFLRCGWYRLSEAAKAVKRETPAD